MITGKYNRAKKAGLPLYCDRTCAGLGRRSKLSEEEKKARKAEYDKVYKEKNRERIKLKKHEYFKRTYDPVQASIYRKARMQRHIEYLRQPKWVEYKRVYGRIRQAKKMAGEFWESYLLIRDIQAQYDDDMVRQENNLHNKAKRRKRQWQSKEKTKRRM